MNDRDTPPDWLEEPAAPPPSADPRWHGCIHPGCKEFGSFGFKRRGPDGKPVYDWYCRPHRPAAVDKPAEPERRPAAPVPKGQGRLAL